MVEEGVYENPWLYEGKPFTTDDINDFFGYVYRIINLQNGREYIGRKYFSKFRTPKGKKRKVKSESDWKKYYGSCPELKEEIGKIGRENFSRTILSLHYMLHPSCYLQLPLLKSNHYHLHSSYHQRNVTHHPH